MAIAERRASSGKGRARGQPRNCALDGGLKDEGIREEDDREDVEITSQATTSSETTPSNCSSPSQDTQDGVSRLLPVLVHIQGQHAQNAGKRLDPMALPHVRLGHVHGRQLRSPVQRHGLSTRL
ncbi:hypothetical protein Z517_09217 [Fonsecaea pedrosoi CBS 271.37]|uniref:Uncharacterized protein n=1 Tax=Fonsecaea pedrosoi CBS 271.37 TaxID=1442368 RepID=A0A0D2G7W5_9EURO|nr:uncharacterized protein Z517_09217 [Fonsecaea pedrosoi CBS 271.37]KIW76773.1 hypothetical protein Z517_09217 [Fonsecaea pedrosoi CBS 271.37]